MKPHAIAMLGEASSTATTSLHPGLAGRPGRITADLL
jgi:hypothetical protein